jgi:hypothetical protein
MSETDEKRMIADTGYEVIHAVHIGNREILLAENKRAADGNFYMKAEYNEIGLLSEYSRVFYGSDYLSVMKEFTGAINEQIDALRGEYDKADYRAKPVTAEECYPHDYGQDLTGKIVAIKAEVLRPEYRRGDVQMVVVTGGSGAKPNARGSAVYCYHLNDGKHTRFERREVLGEIKNLPDWAIERLADIKAKREGNNRETDGLEGTKPEEAETNAGYTITERVTAGKTLFVLGENRQAGQYVTWQRYEGREGYDYGHYFENRGDAAHDLHERAARAEKNLGRDPRTKSRDDAR